MEGSSEGGRGMTNSQLTGVRNLAKHMTEVRKQVSDRLDSELMSCTRTGKTYIIGADVLGCT